VNYPWEIAQSFFYKGMQDLIKSLWHCFIASLGDGVLVVIIFTFGSFLFRSSEWFHGLGLIENGFTIITGFLIAVIVEFLALHGTHAWTYTEDMPLVPLLNVGLLPVLQMMILPSIILKIVSAWQKRHPK
jgi:hypothetical protein